MTSREHWHLLAETDDLLDHHGLLLSPTRSLPDAEQQLAASGLRGPGFDDLLASVRDANHHTSRAVQRARDAHENSDPHIPQQRPPSLPAHDHFPTY